MPRWFRKHTVGYGWTPATWQGWAVTGLFIAANMALALFARTLGRTRILEIVGLLTVVLIAVAVFTSGKDSDP